MDLSPAWCSLRYKALTLIPGKAQVERGGYKVHLVPGPSLMSNLSIIREKAPGSRVNLVKLPRGKAMSGLPRCKGSNMFPKAPSKAGITMKKIIVMA